MRSQAKWLIPAFGTRHNLFMMQKGKNVRMYFIQLR